MRISLPALAVFALTGACLAPLNLLAAPRLPTDPAEVLERLPLRPGDATARELAGLAGGRDPSRQGGSGRSAAGHPTGRALLRAGHCARRPALHRLCRCRHGAVCQEPDARPCWRFAGSCGNTGMTSTGRWQDFAAALEADPQFASAHAWRGAIFLVQADYAAATSECDALLALDRPTLYGGCIGLVLAYGGRDGGRIRRLAACPGRDP